MTSPPPLSFRIGIDGGGTKTEGILVDAAGQITARHRAPGCNPSIVGTAEAQRIVTEALDVLRSQAPAAASIQFSLFCMAGSRAFWRSVGDGLAGFGRIITQDDSLPVLELATNGNPGLVLHAGTGSFIAVRSPDGSIHYAGGLGWRFGDPGSGYELGRRAIGRALLELQGWSPPSRLGPAIRAHTELGDSADARAITRYFYEHAEPNRVIAALAPVILHLAAEGDPAAHQLVTESTTELLDLAQRLVVRFFPPETWSRLPAGLSGPLLAHPVVRTAFAARSPLSFQPVEGSPIDGVRRLLLREN